MHKCEVCGQPTKYYIDTMYGRLYAHLRHREEREND